MSDDAPPGRAESIARLGAGRGRPTRTAAQQLDAFTGRDVRGRARQLDLFDVPPESPPTTAPA